MTVNGLFCLLAAVINYFEELKMATIFPRRLQLKGKGHKFFICVCKDVCLEH